jgi:hypothetical protein
MSCSVSSLGYKKYKKSPGPAIGHVQETAKIMGTLDEGYEVY